MTTKQKMQTALAVLGSDPDSIAANLLQRGYYGERRSSCKCPVARYLGTECGIERAWVGNEEAYDDYADTVKLSATVQDFIEMFDSGIYPALEI